MTFPVPNYGMLHSNYQKQKECVLITKISKMAKLEAPNYIILKNELS